ncbi:nucleotidyltransferase family protein [Blastococcus sp. SYSU DS1021]
MSRVDGVRALMLYGSYARGDATDQSDIDLLALTDGPPGAWQENHLSLTAYAPGHLRVLAQRGSLFVLHLCREGKVLLDPHGTLRAALSSYRPPRDTMRLASELVAAASGLLSASEEERKAHGPAMRALAYYIVRSLAYDACARQGATSFSLTTALTNINRTDLLKPLSRRRLPYSPGRLAEALRATADFCDLSAPLPWPSLTAAAVDLAIDRPLASSLLSSVLIGDSVPYTSITLPPS